MLFFVWIMRFKLHSALFLPLPLFFLSIYLSFLPSFKAHLPSGLCWEMPTLLLLKSSAFPHRWNESQVKANGYRQLRSLLPSRQQHLTRSPKVVACHLSLPTAKRGAGAFPRQSHLGERQTLMKSAIFLQNCFSWHLGCDVTYKIEALGECRCRFKHWRRKGGKYNPEFVGQGHRDNVRAEACCGTYSGIMLA